MADYFLTVFDPSGNTLVNERFEAENEEAAKTRGEVILKEKELHSHTHRLVNAAGKLILFHR
ncbi:YhzD family protein [Bacillus stercoris]|uniref:YhzD family protein n=1 Tax=Bacillus stercoris TaxID=2054641 RepID=UPI002573FBB7|nr:YhzD family protein [Bacillus stercoris]MDL9995222.1 YhzD family protein [Bacillus stercoris]MEC2109777.1 YhzD family protein [Bacillus stercoris]